LKVFEKSPFSGENRSITLGDRIIGIWRFGLSWNRDLQAQQLLIDRLKKGLDNKFILLHNVPLPSLPMPVPLILIGPPGVQAIYASTVKGVFRAKGENWLILDAPKKRYVSVQPNLIKRAYIMSQAVQDYLFHREILLPGVEPVLFFSQSGLHVEPVQSITRIVQRDGIDRFLSSILQSPVIMSSSDGQIIAEVLLKSDAKNSKANAGPETHKPKGRGVNKKGLQPWQWLLIVLLILFILVALTLLAYIFLTAV
jgi:hypothetical protein